VSNNNSPRNTSLDRSTRLRNTYRNGTRSFNLTGFASNDKGSNASVTILPSNNTGMTGSAGSGKRFKSSGSTNTTGSDGTLNNNTSGQ
jgi:hypothetical protein